MKTKTILALSLVAVNTLFAADIDLTYDHHVKVGLNDFQYEYMAKEKIYINAVFHYKVIEEIYGGGLHGGYVFAPSDSSAFIMSIGATLLDNDNDTNIYPTIGIKFREDITPAVSVGLNAVSFLGMEKHEPTTIAFEMPITYHFGEKRNFDIEFKPTVGLGRAFSRSHQFAGVDIHVGYSF